MKIGFEIHQQLSTNKLFCSCPSELTEKKADTKVIRKLRPTQSELGEIDRAALKEFLKGRYYEYEVHNTNVCLVELDEEPPHLPNEEAIDIAIEISLLLNAKIVDEIHFMRKIVIDGSNTSGFQRTAIIAMNGYIETENGKVRIPTICLEEEAARKIGEENRKVIYRLDRLGIPLVEISTAPDISSPSQAREVALKIGEILRSTGKVRRGIGTIRQDINISVEGGARVEIKGVQDLNLIPKIVEREIKRQKKLIEVKKELKNRNIDVDPIIEDVSDIFINTKSNIIRKVGKVYALRLRGFRGLLKDKLGPELAQYASVVSGVRGIIHIDELPGYGITRKEVEKINKRLRLREQDAFVLVVSTHEVAYKALNAVLERALMAFNGVPEETRMALKDGSTKYMRPLPGAARMYPETDIPPLEITKDRIERIRRRLPELIDEKIERYIKQYSLSRELASQIAKSEYASFFEKIAEKTKVSPSIIAYTLTSTLKEIRREGYDTSKISKGDIEEVFMLVEKGKIAKEIIPDILVEVIKKNKRPTQLVKQFAPPTKDELSKLIRKILDERREFVIDRGMHAMKPLMGVIMKEVRGKVDGKLVMEILKKELREFLGE